MFQLFNILSIFLTFTNFGLINCKFEDRLNLTFTIVASYHGENIEGIGLRGSGLGLNWHSSIPMLEHSNGEWTFDIEFKSGPKGFECLNCDDLSESLVLNGDDLKIQFFALAGNGSETEIANKGPYYRIHLPVSKVSSAFEDKPVFTFHPYFFNTAGSFFTLDVDSGNPQLGTRNVVVYLPPGVSENPRPVYSKYFVIDLNHDIMELGKSDIDRIFSEEASHDVILVGHGDWKFDPLYQDIGMDRGQQLTPVSGDNLVCKEGTLFDLCNNCLPTNISLAEDFLYWMTVGGCGKVIVYGGNADDNINFLLGPAYDAIDSHLKSNYMTSITDAREGTFVIGYSLGGLFSCYAAWTRPESFGGAGCQSSSFWWPTKISDSTVTSQFYFVESTLTSHIDDRLPQKILIDVGEPEEDSTYLMVTMAEMVYDILGTHPEFVKDENLWLQVFPGELHSTFVWTERVWSVFSLLSGN